MSAISTSSSSGSFNYDSSDFDMDILDDVDILSEVIELYCAPVQTQSEDFRRVRKTNKRQAKRVLKHSSSSLTRKSKLTMLEKVELATGPVVESSSAVTLFCERDEYFQNRFLRTLSPRPQAALPDSIMYFPAAMVGCLNSGDNLGLADLLHYSMNEECELGIYCFNSRLTTRAFLKFFELLNIIHPDRILCLSGSNIEHNHITASGVMKFTDCKLLFDYVSKTVNEPDLMSLFNTRADHLKRRLFIADRSDEERQQMVRLVESDSDLVIYGSIQFHVTFDAATNKATGLYLSGGLTSAHPALVEAVEA